jgi:hypothetical protein
MYLTRAQLFGVSPFGTLDVPFCDADGEPRMVTVVHGAGGVGKTTLLRVLSSTRPGHAVALLGRAMTGAKAPAQAMCHWHLGDDDPERPHPLVVCTPNMRPHGDEESSLLQRREQAMFDKQAKERGGFVFTVIPAGRWYSPQAVSLHAPLRTAAHYDVKASSTFDDASRSESTRDTKLAIAYAVVSAAVAPKTQRERNRLRETSTRPWDTRLLGNAMRDTIGAVLDLVGYQFDGVDPVSLEPSFTTPSGNISIFDRLPTHVRHLLSIAAMPVRTLWAAYPGQDPRMSPGVVAIDALDLHQPPEVASELLSTLRAALPRVQWIATTASAEVAAAVDAAALLSLRRLPEEDTVELFEGVSGQLH